MLYQLCRARDPVEGFARPSLGFHCRKSFVHKVVFLIVLNLTFLMQVVLSTTLSCLLQLQFGFKPFQYISLS